LDASLGCGVWCGGVVFCALELRLSLDGVEHFGFGLSNGAGEMIPVILKKKYKIYTELTTLISDLME
jgi:hypothetical protein